MLVPPLAIVSAIVTSPPVTLSVRVRLVPVTPLVRSMVSNVVVPLLLMASVVLVLFCVSVPPKFRSEAPLKVELPMRRTLLASERAVPSPWRTVPAEMTRTPEPNALSLPTMSVPTESVVLPV